MVLSVILIIINFIKINKIKYKKKKIITFFIFFGISVVLTHTILLLGQNL